MPCQWVGCIWHRSPDPHQATSPKKSICQSQLTTSISISQQHSCCVVTSRHFSWLRRVARRRRRQMSYSPFYGMLLLPRCKLKSRTRSYIHFDLVNSRNAWMDKNVQKQLTLKTMQNVCSFPPPCLGLSVARENVLENLKKRQQIRESVGDSDGRKAVSLLGHCTVDISIGEDGPRMTCIFLTQNYVYETGGSDNAIVG